MCSLGTGGMIGEAFCNLEGPQEIYCLLSLSPGKLSVSSTPPSCNCGREVGGGISLLVNILQVSNGNTRESRKEDGSLWHVWPLLLGLKKKKTGQLWVESGLRSAVAGAASGKRLTGLASSSPPCF